MNKTQLKSAFDAITPDEDTLERILDKVFTEPEVEIVEIKKRKPISTQFMTVAVATLVLVVGSAIGLYALSPDRLTNNEDFSYSTNDVGEEQIGNSEIDENEDNPDQGIDEDNQDNSSNEDAKQTKAKNKWQDSDNPPPINGGIGGNDRVTNKKSPNNSDNSKAKKPTQGGDKGGSLLVITNPEDGEDIVIEFPMANPVLKPRPDYSPPNSSPCLTEYTLGDVNGDGLICLSDVVEILIWLVNRVNGTNHSTVLDNPASLEAALITNNSKEKGEPDALDVLDILKFISNISGFSPELTATGITPGGCQCCCKDCKRPGENHWGTKLVKELNVMCWCNKGDINGDGKINIDDVLEILKFLAGISDNEITKGGELSVSWHNSIVALRSEGECLFTPNIHDVLEILKYLAGIKPNSDSSFTRG